MSEEVVRLVRQHIVHCLSGASALDFVKVDKTQAADINVSKLHKNYLQLHEPEAIDPHTCELRKESRRVDTLEHVCASDTQTL